MLNFCVLSIVVLNNIFFVFCVYGQKKHTHRYYSDACIYVLLILEFIFPLLLRYPFFRFRLCYFTKPTIRFTVRFFIILVCQNYYRPVFICVGTESSCIPFYLIAQPSTHSHTHRIGSVFNLCIAKALNSCRHTFSEYARHIFQSPCYVYIYIYMNGVFANVFVSDRMKRMNDWMYVSLW